jgi:hypothetical protein
MKWRRVGLLTVVAGMVLCRGTPAEAASTPSVARPQEEAPADPAYRVKEIKRAPAGLRVVSPDGEQYVVSKKDDRGVYLVYVGKTGSSDPVCISDVEWPGSPKVSRNKMQVTWHPSGRWLIMAAERDEDSKPFFAKRDFPGTPKLAEGWLQCGLWVNAA